MICDDSLPRTGRGGRMAGGCGLLPDCQHRAAPSRSRTNRPPRSAPLKVPAGSDLPDTRNALNIPAVIVARAAQGRGVLRRSSAELRRSAAAPGRGARPDPKPEGG